MNSDTSALPGSRDLLRRDLEREEAPKTHFLAMMSHEVRTTLAGVLGMIDLVIDTPLSDDQRGMLARARESSMALLAISNDILDFSKIEAGMLGIESRPLSLASLVEDVCATFAAEAARKAIGLSRHVNAAIPPLVAGDPVRLRQVLTNLIGNAVKFTHRGGVRVEALPTAGGELELVVQDTGIGIDARAVETLFEPFRQADVATTRRYGGTGLGLTIVRQLARLMNGSVRCESTPGVGSRFTVILPLRPWAPGADAASGDPRQPVTDATRAAAPAPLGQGQRVLLAEDHPINREVVARQLLKLGYECECAEDGQQAWEMLKAGGLGRYAMLLTDCHMPGLDGYELTRRWRAREARRALPRLPIVALTADVLQGEAERCLAAGMDACLSKPVRAEDLRAALSKLPRGGNGAAPAAGPRPYARLMELCAGDSAKVAELVRVFVRATEEDMAALDRAAEAADARTLGQLAHRMSSACHQLDEDDAVGALRTVERLAQSETLHAAYRAARGELDAVMSRARAFAG
jgi:signal transduction histidine kinase